MAYWAAHTRAKNHYLNWQTTRDPTIYPPRQLSGEIGFLSLPPEARNTIYELVYRYHNKGQPQITVSAEKGGREVPSVLSRTCKQIRSETLPYFFDGATVIFVVTDAANLNACKEWISFIPRYAVEMMRRVRIRHSHHGAAAPFKPHTVSTGHCMINFELGLDDSTPRHTTYWGHGNEKCPLCFPPDEGAVQLVPYVKILLEEMHAEGTMSRSGLKELFEVFEPLGCNSTNNPCQGRRDQDSNGRG